MPISSVPPGMPAPREWFRRLALPDGYRLACAMATAQQQLDGFLKKYSPEMEKLGRSAIAHMRKRLPGAFCLVYDNYNALAVGFGQPTRFGPADLDRLLSRWATLFFMFGATLDDPEGLLEGKGARIRSVRLVRPPQLKSEPIDQLITAAVLQAGWKLDPKAKGDLVIKSISPNSARAAPDQKTPASRLTSITLWLL